MVEADVTLYKDIGLYPDYSKSMYFTSKTQQTNWFNSIPSSKRVELTNVNYNKIHNAFRVHEPVGDVYAYTYIRIRNMDDSGRVYYGFVSSVTLIDDETTEFTIDLDALQTFMCEWSLGECLVSREHVDRWNTEDARFKYVTPNLENVTGFTNNVHMYESIGSTIKMGVIAFIYSKFYYVDEPVFTKVENEDSSIIKFAVIPISTLNLDYYFKADIQKYDTAKTDVAIHCPKFEDFVNGSVPIRCGINPESCIGAWIINVPNCSINESTAIDFNDSTKTRNTVNFFVNKSRVEIDSPNNSDNSYVMDKTTAFIEGDPSKFDLTQKLNYGFQIVSLGEIASLFEDENAVQEITYSYPQIPVAATHLKDPAYEPALFMEPYSQRGICSRNGTPILKIPDNVYARFTDGIAYLHIQNALNASGVDNILTIRANNIMTNYDRQIAGLEGANTIDNCMQSDIVSNNWLSYCLTSRDSDRKVMQTQMITNAITNMVGMGYGGALVGSRSNSGRNDPMGGGNAGNVAGFKKGMAMASAFGAATGAVASIAQGYEMWVQQEAKETSIKNQPSTMLSTGSGIANIFDKNDEYYPYENQIDDVNYKKAFDNFVKYGYMVNRIETPNIQSRYYFNYICTLNTSIKGSLSSEIKQALVNIFERGITLFHADHCDSTEYPIYENIERSLL